MVWPLKRTVLALEICSGLKQSAVFWFGFFPLCLRTQCELLAQDRSIQSGRLQPRWGRGVTTILRMVVNCMAWNMLFHHRPSGKRHWRWPMGGPVKQTAAEGARNMPLVTMLWCSAGTMCWGGRRDWLLISMLAPWSADLGCPISSFGWEWASFSLLGIEECPCGDENWEEKPRMIFKVEPDLFIHGLWWSSCPVQPGR